MGESNLIDWHKYHKRYYCIGSCVGISFLPCLCIGLIPLSKVGEDQNEMRHLHRIVDTYGEKTLKRLSPAVLNEHKIFLKACIEVNETTKQVFPTATLLDAIEVGLPGIGYILNYIRHQDMNMTQDKRTYLSNVFVKYNQLGGKIDIVIYGLPEYILLIYPEINSIVKAYYTAICGQTQLRELVMSYKDSALALVDANARCYTPPRE